MTEEELIEQATVWKKELIEEVIPHYKRGDSERGNLAFKRWKDSITNFLKEHLPTEANRFMRATWHFQAVVKRNEHPYDRFMREDGKTCLAFLDDLIGAAQKERLEFSRNNSINNQQNSNVTENDNRTKETETTPSKLWRGIVFCFKILLSLSLVSVSIASIFLPQIQSWKWLQEHPNKLGLYASSVIIASSISWAILDSKRRWFALGTVGLGGLFVLVQIIGK